MGVNVDTIELRPIDRLARIPLKEFHVRKLDDSYYCFVALDKYKEQCVLAQKLTNLVNHINSQVEAKCDQVSLTGLWEIIRSGGQLTSGYTKHRWRVMQVPFDNAAMEFDSVRRSFQRAFVVGQPECYQVECA